MRRKIEILLFLVCLLVLPNYLAKQLAWWFSLSFSSKHTHMMALSILSHLPPLFGGGDFLSQTELLSSPKMPPLRDTEVWGNGELWDLLCTGSSPFLSPPQPPSLGSHYLPALLSLIYISPVDNRDSVYSTWMNQPWCSQFISLSRIRRQFPHDGSDQIPAIWTDGAEGEGHCLDSTVLFSL